MRTGSLIFDLPSCQLTSTSSLTNEPQIRSASPLASLQGHALLVLNPSARHRHPKIMTPFYDMALEAVLLFGP